ncbi:LON peptidase substrate-binding domain-containing protein [Pseudonocardia sp. KRD291]|uniref:LON peptidase substrate-binding domain-containing protein n=1 Tax=Pseudonocardia sp. KRD291 TaxID=2792007 RepID=UPI001C4A3F89|nr:LON peptidase substrate-binding domain-containing protein [Pseudonocardia sp. KRD291]MBW0102974.1 LON peptidase substrate-binding domain-containing protein [Pseudonocardia sp. KRD291]
MAATIPLFPLGTVLMPGAALPLHIFEPRYRQLTVDLITGEVPDKEFGVVAVREGHSPDADGLAGLYGVGCTAALIDARRLPDGRYDVVTRGARRFRLIDLDTESRPYLTGSVEFLPDVSENEPDERLIAMLDAAAREAHRRYCGTAWRSDDWAEPKDDTPPDQLAHLLAADCLLPMDDRQALLEQTSPVHRLREIRMLLAREAGLLERLHAVPAPLGTFPDENSPN